MMERKTFDAQSEVKEGDRGIVHAVVSVFGGAPDSDGDIVEKGSFADEIRAGKAKGKLPPGVWAHAWDQPVAKTLDAWEDEQGLNVVGQFNLETQVGRETFSNIKHGLITEYSFGFETVTAERRGNTRHIQKVKWYEWSPVLVGANRSTFTVSAKGLLSGESLAGDTERLLSAARELAGVYRGLSEKDGQPLSPARKERLRAMRTQFTDLEQELAALLAETDAPPADDGKGAGLDAETRALYTQHLRRQAQLRTLGVTL